MKNNLVFPRNLQKMELVYEDDKLQLISKEESQVLPKQSLKWLPSI